MKKIYKILTLPLIIVFLIQNTGWTVPSNELSSVHNPIPAIFIPEQYGKIEKSMNYGLQAFCSPRRGSATNSPKSPMVILIKDAHCNYSAQKNIANILELLINEYGVKTICAEGATDTIDLSMYRNFPGKKRRNETCDAFVKKGYFSAIELLGITKADDKNFRLLGVEDTKLYLENFLAFRNTIGNLADYENTASVLMETINKLKQKVYSEGLLTFDNKASEYSNNKITLSDWIKYLDAVDQELKTKKNTGLVLESIALEENIDFKQIEQERFDLIKNLEKNLPKESLHELVKKSLEYKLGKLSSLDYYTYLENYLSQETGAESYENLKQYIEIVKLQDSIDEKELFSELKKSESAIYDKLIKDEKQDKLRKIDYSLSILNKLFKLTLTREDLAYYKNSIEKNIINDLKTMSGENGIPFPQDVQMANTEELPNNFYDLALKRDQALADNLTKIINSTKEQYAVLVAGGFHSDGIMEILKAKDIPYIVISPKVTAANESNLYYSVMMDKNVDIAEINSYIASAIPFPKAGSPLAQIVDPTLQASVCKAFASGLTGGQIKALINKCTGDQRDALKRVLSGAGVTIDETAVSAEAEGEIAIDTDGLIRLIDAINSDAALFNAQTIEFIRSYFQELAQSLHSPFQFTLDRRKWAGRALISVKTEPLNTNASAEQVLRYLQFQISNTFNNPAFQHLIGTNPEILKQCFQTVLDNAGNNVNLATAVRNFARINFQIIFDSTYNQLVGDDTKNGRVIINPTQMQLIPSTATDPTFMVPIREILLAVSVLGHEICGHEAEIADEELLSQKDALMTYVILDNLFPEKRAFQSALNILYTHLESIAENPQTSLYLISLERLKNKSYTIDAKRVSEAMRMDTTSIENSYRSEDSTENKRFMEVVEIAGIAPKYFKVLQTSVEQRIEDELTVGLSAKISNSNNIRQGGYVQYLQRLEYLINLSQSLSLPALKAHAEELKEKTIQKVQYTLLYSIIAALRNVDLKNRAQREKAVADIFRVTHIKERRELLKKAGVQTEWLDMHIVSLDNLASGKFDTAFDIFISFVIAIIDNYYMDKVDKYIAKKGPAPDNVDVHNIQVFCAILVRSGRQVTSQDIQQKLDDLDEWRAKLAEVDRFTSGRSNFAKTPIGVITDIHGNGDALEKLVNEMQAQGVKDWRILGDLFDRGKQNRKVFRIVKELKEDPTNKFTFIMGNHELMLLYFVLSGDLDYLCNLFINGGLPFFDEFRLISPSEKQEILKIIEIYEQTRNQRQAFAAFANWLNASGQSIKNFRERVINNPDLMEIVTFILDNAKMYNVDKETGILSIHNSFPLNQDGTLNSAKSAKYKGKPYTDFEMFDQLQLILKTLQEDLRQGRKSNTENLTYLYNITQAITVERDWLEILRKGGQQVIETAQRELSNKEQTRGTHMVFLGHNKQNITDPTVRQNYNMGNTFFNFDFSLAYSDKGGAGVVIDKTKGMRIFRFDPASRQTTVVEENMAGVDPDYQTMLDTLFPQQELTALYNEMNILFGRLNADLLTTTTTAAQISLNKLNNPGILQRWFGLGRQAVAMEWMQVPEDDENYSDVTDISGIRQNIMQARDTAKISFTANGVLFNFYIDTDLHYMELTEQKLRELAEEEIRNTGITFAPGTVKDIVIAGVKSKTYFVNHMSDDFIGVNASFSKFPAKYKEIFKEIGLAHELRHELTGRGEKAEDEFRQIDLVKLSESAGKNGINIAVMVNELLELKAISTEAVKDMFYNALKQVLGTTFPRFTCPDKSALFMETETPDLGKYANIMALIIDTIKQTGIGQLDNPLVKSLASQALNSLTIPISNYLRDIALDSAKTVVRALSQKGNDINPVSRWIAGEGSESNMPKDVSVKGLPADKVRSFRESITAYRAKLPDIIRGARIINQDTVNQEKAVPILQPVDLKIQGGIIAQRVSDIFMDVSIDKSGSITYTLSDDGFKEWFEQIEDNNQYRDMSFWFTLDEQNKGKEAIYRRLLLEFTGFSAAEFNERVSIKEALVDVDLDAGNRQVVYLGNFSGGEIADFKRPANKKKFIQKGKTGLPVAM